MNKLISIIFSACLLISSSFALSALSNKSEESTTRTKNDKDDEKSAQEENLRNIATPYVVDKNVANNLQLFDNKKRLLNKQMMLEGPQGGIQSNKPRGI